MSAMASRLLRRSKTPSLSSCRFLHPSAPTDPVASAPYLRSLASLASHPLPDPRSASAAAPILGRAPVFGHLGSGKIYGYEKILPNCTVSSLNGSAQIFARSFHVQAQGGEMKTQADNKCLQNNDISNVVRGVGKPNCSKGKESDCSKVMAFSPLEGTLTRERKSGLMNESLKVKRMELSMKTTYALIPALLLISKTKLTTSMLVLCIYWQVYGFFKEIFLDYIHHEVTRKWVLIYFKLLLFILAKDTILTFDLVL